MMQFSSSQAAKTGQETQKKEDSSQNERIYTRFCTNCGFPLEPDDLFCSECGFKIEQKESVVDIKENEETSEQASVNISPDRMASILQANRIKSGEVDNEFRKMHSLSDSAENALQVKKTKYEKKLALSGQYVYRDSYMTQYLIIERRQGSSVRATVRTIFDNGGYSSEFYEGTLSNECLRLHIVNSDLRPPPDEWRVLFGITHTIHHTIKLSERFDGTVGEDVISGSFAGEFSKSVVFRKC